LTSGVPSLSESLPGAGEGAGAVFAVVGEAGGTAIGACTGTGAGATGF